nr:MAK10-like protein [Tanacetum cinerariifolium]
MTTASSFWRRCQGIVRFRPLFNLGNENLIRTLEDYSKPSHEGYRNTIELPEENNVVPLRSDTIRVHFINSIVIINKESKVKEEGSMRCNGAKSNDHKRLVKAKEEVGDESEKELEEETKEESEEEKEDDLEYFNTFPTMEELRYHE